MSPKKLPANYLDLAQLEYEWPKSGDRLLKPAVDLDRGISFASDSFSRHAHIWTGYMMAGAALIDVCDEDPQARFFLAYPILYNYRHGLELAIKWIVSRYGGQSSPNLEHHNLWRLWIDCREIVGTIGDDEALEVVEGVIRQFHQIDPGSIAFRYWQKKDGRLHPLPEVPVDLDNLRLVMERVDNFFEGADGALSAR